MLVQVLDDRFFQTAGAEAVNHPHDPLLGEQALVEKLLEPIDRLIDRAADQQQFAGRARLRAVATGR